MKFIDFFAGIGGFRLGMEMAGHECVGFCEYDKFATASYTSMHLITDKQREYLSTLNLRERQKEILKPEYRNGEWYAKDIKEVKAINLPKADCWCFGSPCVDFSIAGKRAGLSGGRSGLVQQIFRLLNKLEKEDRPEWLIYENVKGMFSSNHGWDYATILSEMEWEGYDIEWQNINSKWFVPQNRERIYTIGHLRRYGRRKVFPIRGGNKEASGVSGQTSNTITTRTGTANTVGTYVVESQQYAQVKQIIGGSQGSRVYDPSGIGVTLSSQGDGQGAKTGLYIIPKNTKLSGCIPMEELSPEEFQENYRIRKLTPKECFRLQGFSNKYFERAAFVNSDSQLYKQIGNSVTVNVVHQIAQRMEKTE